MAITAPASHASYGYYVGKNLTADGSVLLGGTGEEPSSHWLEIVPRRSHPADATIEVGATPAARLPARLIEIPPGPRDLPLHHHELHRLRRLSGAAHQRRAERAPGRDARHLVELPAGTGGDDAGGPDRAQLLGPGPDRAGARRRRRARRWRSSAP
ncbi:MAG: hypothetical protein U5R48_11265 [Gammaproteobacteria bacterium]|nr:hypothetical protein [Gammaproteobacteria bacterium]